jgi:hypothetical protein
MSCYEWEQGTITLPTKAWPKFKEDVRKAWNACQATKRMLANELYNALVTAGKGQREFDWGLALQKIVEAKRSYVRGPWSREWGDEAIDDASRMVLPYERHKLRGSAGGPLKPKAKDLPDANAATKTFHLGEASIAFDESAHAVTWTVAENNHAIKRAREHPVAIAMFAALKRVEWTRGSGGTITGNDEYNREAREAGGGGNQINQTFGPAGRAARDNAFRVPRGYRARPAARKRA